MNYRVKHLNEQIDTRNLLAAFVSARHGVESVPQAAVVAPRGTTAGHLMSVMGSMHRDGYVTIKCESHRAGCLYGYHSEGNPIHFRTQDAAKSFAMPHMIENHPQKLGSHGNGCPVCRWSRRNGE